jgi:hypothetical protein
MWAFVDANPTPDAKRLRDVWLTGLLIHDDAFLPISNGWTVVKTLIVAFLWLTIVFLENCNSHEITSNLPELHHQ